MGMTIEILEKFCSKTLLGQSRTDYPWSDGNYTYATDNCLLIRVPRIQSIPENESAPKVENIFINNPPGKDAYPIPLYNPNSVWDCNECQGTGRVLWHNGIHSYEAECAGCFGKKQLVKYENVYIAKSQVSQHYIDLIITYLPSTLFYPRDPSDPIFFKFNGGDGILLPMKPIDETIKEKTP